ncbi:MAG TPA: TonB-dependent receptor [Bacteroidetes bacterium]|nr:TonB-dependent receptor [Bacteroidota bacterium]
MGLVSFGFAQKGTVSGTLTDADGPLIGASVVVVGTSTGAVTDIDGSYSIKLDPGTYDLEASYTGYGSQRLTVTVKAGETTAASFLLSAGISLDDIVVTGTRASNRTNTDAPVPVDVINVSKLSAVAPQTSINQLLQNTAPSFSSNTQTISDGTDHIDPASLRGLGPDQVLVLLNGKRRHTTSLVNVNGTFGRGNVGTDLNAIPAAAIQAIEVLRDGAAAQYGSDAIAGVINVRMKEDVNKLSFNLTSGANFTSEIGPFGGEKKNQDGEVVNLGINYGLPMGNNGGFINFTGEFNYRGSTNRMQEFQGGIFNALNAVENVALQNKVDISSWGMQDVQAMALNVSHSGDLMQQIANAPDLETLQDLLGTDVTDAELAARGQVRSDYNMRVGQSALRGGKFFANMKLPVGENMEFYSFGGIGYRRGESGCFYRLPSQSRTTTSVYPNGTVPRINSNIVDRSIATGIRGMVGNWNVDLSNTWGSNSFNFFMTNTHNATLGPSTPTTFDSGGHSFTQNTANFDMSQYFDNIGSIKGINIAFGAEYRFENFREIPGTELSWGNYDINGNLVNSVTPSELLSRDFLGRNRPSGAQCFAGFLPTNDVDANRSSAAGYIDTEFDLSDAFLVTAAVRFENYPDFGSTFNYKLASRYKVTDNVSLRGAFSTGFRAPSLHQINFSRTSTIFELVNGVSVAQERGTFANTSRAAKLLGIPELKEETSVNYSLGFTAKMPELGVRLTVDAYQVNIDDRVVLTGGFSAGDDEELQSIFQQAGATQATFFANAIDTKSKGLDIVISHRTILGQKNTLTNDFAATFSQTEWDQGISQGDLDSDDDRIVVNGVKASKLLAEKGLVGTYFDQQSRIYLEQAVPRTKLTLSHTLTLDKTTIYLRNTLFGETTEATNEAIFDKDLNLTDKSIDPYNSAKVITDLSVGYNFTPSFSLTIGANNLLDIYPDESDHTFWSSGRFRYSRRSPQFSMNGRFLFARIAFTIE